MRSMITRKERPIWICVIFGAAVALAVTVSLCAVFAKLIVQETIRQEWTGYVCFAVLLGASYLGSIFAQVKASQRAVACFGAGGTYFVVLLSIGAVGYDQGLHGVGVSAVVIACGSAVAMMSYGRKGRRRGGAKRFPNG